MSYTALYRKWRPNTFESVIGQEHIVRTLTNQIKAGKLSHAYLFCGTRGTGKTSTAKIFAKAVNCISPIEGNPCNQCDICTNKSNNQSINIIEIDAASNNGVDNIREIREEVKYTPTEGKYKIYIVDEVHMLSQGAFNALLKTLEEPPEHVIFILATTEPHKLPATILSRCQRYDFKRIGTADIAKTLMGYMDEEKIEYQPEAITYVAKIADGSMRDALSIMDQCIAFYLGEKITLDKALEVLGAVDHTVFNSLTNCLINKDIKNAMDLVELIHTQGRDLQQFLFDWVQYFRNVLVLKNIGASEGIAEISKEYMETLKKQSELLSEKELIEYIEYFSELENKIKYVSQKRILIEVAIIKFCKKEQSTNIDNSSLEGIWERISSLEKKISEQKTVIRTAESVPKENTMTKEQMEEKKKRLKAAMPEDIRAAIGRFNELVQQMDGLEMAMLKKSFPAFLEDEFFYLVCETEIQKNRLILPEITGKINQIMASIHNREFNIRVLTVKEYDMLVHTRGADKADAKEAKSLFEELKAQINFDIQEIDD